MSRRTLTIAMLSMIAATTAEAHTGIGHTNGFVHGFGHPIGGIDHILVMVAVGLFAARLGGRALWLVPLSFVSMMILGSVLGMIGVGLPFVEIGIALSVVILGIAVALGYRMPTAVAMEMVGLFAVFHGHAHGAEVPQSGSGIAYGVGFVLATVSLHALGIGLGLATGRMSHALTSLVLQTAGSAMALAGVVILTGYL
ncbi:MAG: HupE/UreJ family protein [Stellaceae bacterium]